MVRRLASKDTFRLFQFQDKHIAVITGRRPSQCKNVQLVECEQDPPTGLVLECACDAKCGAHGPDLDSYCVVTPVNLHYCCQSIRLLHRHGSETVLVETLHAPSKVSADDFLISNTLPTSAIGISQDFSLEEAFMDAVAKLQHSGDETPRHASLLEVIAMGALYGEFQGFSRLFVKVERTEIPNPS